MEMIKQIHTIAKALNASFTFNERPISVEEALRNWFVTGNFSSSRSALFTVPRLWHWHFVEEAEKSILGVKVVFDDVTPNVLRYLCIADVISELINASPNKPNTPLDELMYD